MKFKTSLIALLLTLLSATAFAHQQKRATTTISFNDRTGYLEVIHRFIIHDAEHAVGELFDKSGVDIHQNPDTQNQFARYVESRFSIATLNGKPIPLETIGFETDNDSFWFYQEAKIPDVEGFQIKHNALRDVWDSQENLVNIEGRGKVQSLVFSGEDETLSIELNPQAGNP